VTSHVLFGENDPSGLILNPVSPFPDLSDRPVSGSSEKSVTGNPAIGSGWLSGRFVSEKTGLYGASFNREYGGEMMFWL
jgi:hypothetical protein